MQDKTKLRNNRSTEPPLWYKRGGGVSEKQWQDVRNVWKVQKPNLDLTYLQATAAQYSIEKLLAKVTSEWPAVSCQSFNRCQNT